MAEPGPSTARAADRAVATRRTRRGGTGGRRPPPIRHPTHPIQIRAAIALAGLVAVPLLLILLAALVLWAIGLVLGGWVLAVLAVALLAFLGWVVRTAVQDVRAARPGPLVGAELHRTHHPELWAAVDAVAIRVGVTAPHRIVVDGSARIALVSGTGVGELVLGFPLLIGLDRDELRSLLTHEFAHAVDGGVRPLAATYRVTQRLAAVRGALRPGPARWAVQRYVWAFLLLAAEPNRRHELRCDDVAARLCGREATASALYRTAGVRTAWTALVDEYLPLAASAQRRPDLADAVRNLVAARAPVFEPAGDADPAADWEHDAHPPTLERIGRLTALPPEGIRHRRGPEAVTLLGESEAVVPDLERAVLVDDDPAAGWAEIIERAALADRHRTAALLARGAVDCGVPEPVTLAAVLDAVAAGRAERLVSAALPTGLTPAERGEAVVATLHEWLSAFVVLAVLARGLARVRLHWDRAPVVERRDVAGAWAPWDGDAQVAAAAASTTGIPPLRAWLTYLGADVDVAVEPAPPPPPRPLAGIADAELAGPFEARPVDVAVYSHGLLVSPVEASGATAVPPFLAGIAARVRDAVPGAPASPRGGASPAATRIARLMDRAGSDPAALPGGWWIAKESVAQAQLRDRRDGIELTLRLTEGGSTTVRGTQATSMHGTPLDDLARLFGPRLELSD